MNQQTVKVIVDLAEKLNGYQECVPKFDIMSVNISKCEYGIGASMTYVKSVQSEVNEYFKPLVEEFIRGRIRQITKELESL